MLHFITDLTDTLLNYIKDDPVRPEIPTDFRVADNRFVAALVDDQQPSAMVCISLHEDVPDSVLGLDNTSTNPTTAVFYTIWSYEAGAGKELLFNAVDEIKVKYPTVTRFVTLSPKTEMARRFHLKNGAVVFRENMDTINYEYFDK
jgi:hypothetical protein